MEWEKIEKEEEEKNNNNNKNKLAEFPREP